MSETKKVKKKAPRNRTLELSDDEAREYRKLLVKLKQPASLEEVIDKTICQDSKKVLDFLPDECVDLFFADPPYNMVKSFNGRTFNKKSREAYEKWLDGWLGKVSRIMKPTGAIYLCGDWRSSTAIERVAEQYFKIQNRITWEREKGRGAKANWKNASEDIWFCTMSDNFVFNLDAVKLKRKVIAPYTTTDKKPKDWHDGNDGRFRLTHPSNLWTDLTVPFWSMPENTDHPTQKPEKLLARIILASSNEGDVVLDPFLGSGTTSVVAKKLGRQYIGIEIDKTYCCIAEKRLSQPAKNSTIQGYFDGVFWERNSLNEQKSGSKQP